MKSASGSTTVVTLQEHSFRIKRHLNKCHHSGPSVKKMHKKCLHGSVIVFNLIFIHSINRTWRLKNFLFENFKYRWLSIRLKYLFRVELHLSETFGFKLTQIGVIHLGMKISVPVHGLSTVKSPGIDIAAYRLQRYTPLVLFFQHCFGGFMLFLVTLFSTLQKNYSLLKCKYGICKACEDKNRQI